MMNFLHKIIKPALACCILVILGGCSSQRIVTTWKTDRLTDVHYKKILVVAILPDKDSALRRKTENNFVLALQQLGYNAISALEEFGAKGLSNSGQENTYLKLYNNGIDA